jgi:aminoglycoside phosphotransferase (APT) family kinase protein
MPTSDAEEALQRARGLLTRDAEVPNSDLQLSARPLRGGLMAELVCVSASRSGARPQHFVLKRVSGSGTREADAYGVLARAGLAHLGPRLLGASSEGASNYLLLEYVPRWKAWPWRDEAYAGLILDTLARLHAAPLVTMWNDEDRRPDDSGSVAAYIIDLLGAAARRTSDARLARGLPAVRGFAARLPEAHALLGAAPVFLHGDVHPGNVLLQGDGRRKRAVLLDWGRARVGSRFEDVASWLQCLRYFEYAAVGAHDRLLLRYIRASGLGDRITPRHRREYWVAAGCNALAGALGVHLSRVLDARSPGPRAAALAAAVDWLRIVRRAEAHLSAGSS